MRKIDKIIRESIDKVITEGYSGKYLEDQVNDCVADISNWLNTYAKYQNTELKNYVFFYLDPSMVGFNRRYGPYSGEEEILISCYIYYKPDEEYFDGVTGTTKVYEDGTIEVRISVDNTLNIVNLKSFILHELTHSIDKLIRLKTKYKVYRHNPLGDLMQSKEFPKIIKIIFYHLWDTYEFNAWQTYSDINGLVNRLNEYIEKAKRIEDKNVWMQVKFYLIQSKVKPFGYIYEPQENVKNYFINTSLKKLKIFKRKVKYKG